MKYGQGLYTSVLQDFLKNGYKTRDQSHSLDGYTRDNDLSGTREQVYHNNDTNQTIVSHRGTQGVQDWITDAKLLFFPKLYAVGKIQTRKGNTRQSRSKIRKGKHNNNRSFFRSKIGIGLGRQIERNHNIQQTDNTRGIL